ncbi:permease [Thauera terpenica 58Eu]|jgi:lipopolysaccharide export system permease protein|uniref:Lipopolysaccharide export system permease protein LptF n=1 Tax=Thauera terpenica 58Eu TaxID=1348657 RepID=S9ZHP4_9RHOO|nr:LPS export ABC transporter permease LptF [Thauera terpenica]EPZ16915.1 permease [Thauera terpenica 58Eu]MBP6760849.1 LPS export ABC transporter permease LptF [Thauera sp.]
MIFRRALQREFSRTAAAVFIALFAILISTVLIRLLGQAAGGRVPADAVLALIGFGALAQLPTVLSLTLFIAILISLSRSYRDSEMVVWFAAGVPLTAWIRPVLMFALPLVLVIGAGSLFLSPWAQQQSGEYRDRIDSRDDTQRIAPGVFRESSGARRVFFVEVGAGVDGRVRNVFVSEETRDGQLVVIASAEGYLSKGADGQSFVVLEHGRRYDGQPGTPQYRVMEFERYEVQIEQKPVLAQPSRVRGLPTAVLLAQGDARSLGELLGRIGVPLSALLLALLAIPLSFVNPRAGRANGLLIALLTYLIYSNAISVFQGWVSQGRVDFALALLLPHVIVLALLGALFYKRLAVSPFWRARSS